MSTKKPLYQPGDRVILHGWQITYPSTVVRKSEGVCTRIRRDIDGAEMTVANTLLTPEEADQ